MTNRDLAKRFGKDRLLKIAEELGIEVDVGDHVYELANTLVQDLGNEGLPEDDVSDDLWDFMIASGFIDEEGNELDLEDGGDDEQKQYEPDKQDDVTKRKCYGFEDDDDPACRRCGGRDACVKKRVSIRPNCFGRMYDEADLNCANCVHWKYCQK